MLEAVVAAVVGVGDVEVGRARPAGSNSRSSRTSAARLAAARAPAGRAGCRGRAARIRSKSREVGRRHLARRALERDAARAGGRRRARVRRVADVPGAGAGAVDLDRVLEPLLAQQRRASRPRRSASGRCCPCRRRAGGPRPRTGCRMSFCQNAVRHDATVPDRAAGPARPRRPRGGREPWPAAPRRREGEARPRAPLERAHAHPRRLSRPHPPDPLAAPASATARSAG